MARAKRPPCPECKSTKVVPIAYGLPAPEMTERVERGEIVLGGCCIGFDNPRWYCPDCHHRWRGELSTERRSFEDLMHEMMEEWRESK